MALLTDPRQGHVGAEEAVAANEQTAGKQEEK